MFVRALVGCHFELAREGRGPETAGKLLELNNQLQTGLTNSLLQVFRNESPVFGNLRMPRNKNLAPRARLERPAFG
jgi:hypothetical protein